MNNPVFSSQYLDHYSITTHYATAAWKRWRYYVI